MKKSIALIMILSLAATLMSCQSVQNNELDTDSVSLQTTESDISDIEITEAETVKAETAETTEVETTEAETTEVEEELVIEGIKVPVLMYHHISDEVTWTGVVTKEKYQADMMALQDSGYESIFLSELYEYLQGNREIPEKSIIITFDDGYASNYEFAYPIMKKLNMKMAISMIGWSVGRTTFLDSDIAITPHFTWEEANIMYDSGHVDLLNHTYDLHSPEGLSYGYKNPVQVGVLPLENESYEDYKTRFTKDLESISNDFVNEMGIKPSFFVYPYGAYNDNSEEILQSKGYLGSVSTNEGIRVYNTIEDLWLIPRLNISQDIKSENLVDFIEGY